MGFMASFLLVLLIGFGVQWVVAMLSARAERKEAEAEARAAAEAKVRAEVEAETECEPAEASTLASQMVDIPGKGFKLCKYEVTQALWEAVMGGNPSKFKGTDRPVECVSWGACQAFIEKLNALPVVKKSGLTYRLPKGEEWEYACRAGSRGNYCKLADGTEIVKWNLNRVAWYNENSGCKTHPVGQKEPNAWGLYDMHGNVCEWTATGELRGGSWCNIAGFCTVGHREARQYADFGFRLVAETPEAKEEREVAEAKAREEREAAEAKAREEREVAEAKSMFYYFKAAGVTMEGRQDILKNMPTTGIMIFKLVREPDNPYDENAIAIMTEKMEHKIGYVPRGTRLPLAMDNGGKFLTIGLLVGGYGPDKNYGLQLRAEPINENDSDKQGCIEAAKRRLLAHLSRAAGRYEAGGDATDGDEADRGDIGPDSLSDYWSDYYGDD